MQRILSPSLALVRFYQLNPPAFPEVKFSSWALSLNFRHIYWPMAPFSTC